MQMPEVEGEGGAGEAGTQLAMGGLLRLGRA